MADDQQELAPSQLRMRRADLKGLPSVTPLLPTGLCVRAAREEEAGPLAALLQRAFESDRWTTERARREFIDAPNVRETLVIVRNDTLLATASVQVPDDPDAVSGIVHWVGVDPDARGSSLGYIVTLAVLHEFARMGLRDAFLITDDFRLPAIKIYLRLGFVPEYRDASHPARWEAVVAALGQTIPPAPEQAHA